MTILDQHGRPLLSESKRKAIAHLRNSATAELSAMYDAAQTTNENVRHWRFADDLSAATANSLAVRSVLRKRSRYECVQSNGFGVGMTKTLATDFVSVGPKIRIELEDRELAKRIEREWARWCKATKLNKKLRVARRAKCVDGESFLLAITNRRIRGPVKLDVRVIEADQMSTPGWIDGIAGDAVDGIKFDPSTGEPIEYHMLRQHPGDRGSILPNPADHRTIDAVDVIHVFNEDRPGQVRGIPELTASLPLFAFLRRYTLATLAAAEIAASYAAVLKTQEGAFDTDDGEVFKPFTAIEIERGMMAALPYGYELQQLRSENPATRYVEFRDALLCEIARPINMPRNKVLGDSSGYNFSSSRMDHQVYYHAIECERDDWEIDVLDRIFEWWLDEALLVPGLIDMPTMDYVPRRWSWKPPASANPLQDAKTETHLIEAGLKLREDYLIENQIDPDRFHERQLEEARRRGEMQRQQPRPDVSDLPATPAVAV
ncbi:MAG: phage portal protein [Planctomycetota bacterium]